MLFLLLCLAISLHRHAAAKEPPAIFRKVGFDQRLNQQVPLDLEFVDEKGKAVKLGDYFGKKPVMLVLAYYRCPMLCTLVLNGLAQAMRQIPFTIGKEFNVVTVSFDPRETPDLAAKKKETYVAAYGRPGAGEGWHFLTGKPDAIEKLTDAVGFRYVYDAKQDQYIHTSGIMVLTPRGKISRYFYGIQYPPPRFAAGTGRGVGREDRLADGRSVALLCPLRPRDREVHRQHLAISFASAACDHDRSDGRHGVVPDCGAKGRNGLPVRRGSCVTPTAAPTGAGQGDGP